MKETAALASIHETEQEAAASLPPGFSLEDVYGPIRSAIERIVGPGEKSGDDSQGKDNELEETEDTAGYYKFLSREEGEENPAAEVGEKFLLSEIEKFRLRQLERDK